MPRISRFEWLFRLRRRAKSFESGRAGWHLARYEPDELPGCSTPRHRYYATCRSSANISPTSRCLARRHATDNRRLVGPLRTHENISPTSNRAAPTRLNYCATRRTCAMDMTLCSENRGSWERGTRVSHHLNTWYLQLFEIASTKTKCRRVCSAASQD